uniref:NAD(P)(+)--arginine ADP-ribosyltransferase n=1 Tax=Arcella intermedia TaxID=1963864 RepID=A0A6B2L1Q3_9EUKA
MAHYEMREWGDASKCLINAAHLGRQGSGAARAWHHYGMVCIATRNAELAIEAFNNAIAADPEFLQSYTELGLLLFEKEDYKSCEECFNRAVKVDPSSIESWNTKGRIALKLKNPAEAKKCVEMALGLDPSDMGAWINQAYYYMLRKNTKEMERSLEVVKKMAQKDRRLEKERKILEWTVMLEMGRFKETLEYFDGVLERDDSNPVDWNFKGIALEKLGMVEEAKKCFEKERSLKVGKEKKVETGRELLGHYSEPSEILPFILGSLMKMEENEKLVSLKEAVKIALGKKFDDYLWENNIDITWKKLYESRDINRDIISFDDFLVVYLYTMEYPIKFFQLLNSDLTVTENRHASLEKWKHFLIYLASALNKIEPWKGDTPLYRGVNADVVAMKADKYKEGEVITWYAFSSTTTDIIQAKDFMIKDKTDNQLSLKEPNGTLFKIEGCFSGRKIAPFSFYPGEKEILFPASSRFKILDTTKEEYGTIIRLQQEPTIDDIFKFVY